VSKCRAITLRSVGLITAGPHQQSGLVSVYIGTHVFPILSHVSSSSRQEESGNFSTELHSSH
jgi:hypothetical protein